MFVFLNTYYANGIPIYTNLDYDTFIEIVADMAGKNIQITQQAIVEIIRIFAGNSTDIVAYTTEEYDELPKAPKPVNTSNPQLN